jgi:DNA-binding SARP family transcriptional activator/tetratricopeptide (TPR) repeat protein
MDTSNDSGNPPTAFPQLRIWLCGPFQMEWVDPTTGAALPAVDPTVGSRDRAAAIALLALLLCQPNRQAHRDWVMEQFWPDGKRDVAIHRLENIFSCLRKLLRPPSGGESLVRSTSGKKNSGTSYCLDPYPALWVDGDALIWNVAQACRMERFGDDALPFWQCAFDLFKRGPFLVGDPYEPYASWVKEQRERLEGYARQCVHALAHLYLARYADAGKAEALLLLRTYWQQYKIDEDALRPLLELLGEQERYQEAEAYYQQLLLALAELGPDEEGQPRTPDGRTRDIREYLCTKQIRRDRTTNKLTQIQSSIAPSTKPPSWSSLSSMRGANSEILLSEAQVIDVSTPARVDTLDMMKSRRQILHELLGHACLILVLSPYTIEHHERSRQLLLSHGDGLDPAVLDDLERITASYWRLCQNASLDLLGSVTEHFQAITHQLKRKQPHEVSQRLCQLVGETAQLLGKTLFDLHEYALSWSYYTFSLKAAQAADNHDLWAVGLGRMSLLLIYWKQPQDAYPLLREARQLTIQCPRIACWLAAVEGEVHAQLGDADACDAALKTAKEFAKSEPLGEDRYATGMNPSRLAGYEGACFVRLRRPERALPVLQQAVALLDPHAVRRQSTIFTDMGMAYAQQGNIQEACKLAKHALVLTTQTKSLSVLERVRLVRQELEPWGETESVQELEKHLDTMFALITA